MRFIALLVTSLAVTSWFATTSDAQRIDLITPRLGGLLGGTRVSILGTGFDIRGRSNDVWIGDDNGGAFCDPIPNECHASRIICLTGEFKANGTLPLQVSSNGVVATCNYDTAGTGCSFTYSGDRTPYVTSIVPQWIDRPSDITVSGINFDRGDKSTGSFDFAAWFGDEERCDLGSNSVSSTSFICSAENGLFPGSNRLSLMLGTRGYASVPQVYGLTVFPLISNVSVSTGSTEGGQIVTITGNFFSRTALENLITVHGAPCVPTEAATGQLVCVTTANAATTTATAPTYVQGVNFDFWGHSIGSEGSIIQARGKLAFLTPELSITVTGFGGTLPIPVESYALVRYTSWYLAPHTGTYNITAYMDDYGELWVGTDENPVAQVRTVMSDDYNYNPQLIISRTGYGTSSGTVDLVAGKRYWVQMYVLNSAGAFGSTVTFKLPDGTSVVNPSANMAIPSSKWVSPVAVTARGMKARYSESCNAYGACDFNYVASSTPVLTSISASSGGSGSAVTLTGQTFAAAASSVTINLGGTVCPVTSASNAQIVFTIPATLAAGTYAVSSKILGYGYARLSAQFTVTYSVSSVSNSNSYLSIKGTGLTVAASRITVTLAGTSDCPVTSVADNEIQCAPSSSLPSGPTSVKVTIADATVATTANNFMFEQTNVRPGTTTDAKAASLLTTAAALFTNNLLRILVPEWTINSKYEVTVTFGNTSCEVFFAQGSTIQCTTESLYQVGSYEVIVRNSSAAISLGSLTLAEQVSSISHNYFSPNGGNVIDIYHSGLMTDELNMDTNLSISYRGVPCVASTRTAFTTARCYLDDASLTANPTLPVLAKYSADTTDVLNQLQYVGSVRTTAAGFVVPTGATLFTRRSFNGSLRVTAEVTPSVSTATCIRFNSLSSEPSLTYSGIEAIAYGTTFTVGRDTWIPTSVASTEIALEAGVTNLWRVDITSGSLAFYIDDVLVASLTSPPTHNGVIGFPASCQDIIVNNLKIEDLTPATLSFTYQGRTVAMKDEPLLLAPSIFNLKQFPSSLQVGATARFSLTTFVTFQIFLFASDATTYQVTPSTINLCTDSAVLASTDTDGTAWATCTVAGIAAGTYKARFRETSNGFASQVVTITVLPTLSSVTPTAPSAYGTLLTISGLGFNGDTSAFTVTVGTVSCPVVGMSETQLVCELPAASSDSARGPFAVSVTFKGAVIGTGSITYITAAASPLINSISSQTRADYLTFNGLRLGSAPTGSFALVGGKVCSIGWGSSTYTTCRFRTGVPAAGSSYTIKYFVRGVGYAYTNTTTAVATFTKAYYSASPDPTGLTSGASITVPAQLLAVDKDFSTVASFDFTTGSYENSKWAISNGLPGAFSCGSEIKGFGTFNSYTVATRSLTGLASHQHLSLTFDIMLIGYDYVAPTVTIDGTVYTLTDTPQRALANGLLVQCSATETFTVQRTFTVPHAATTASISFSVPSYYSGRSWGIRSYAIKVGTLPYAVTVGSAACPITFAEPANLRCTLPAGNTDGRAALAVTESGTPLTCGTTTCSVNMLAASNLALNTLTFATIPGTTTGNDLTWGSTARVAVTSGMPATVSVTGTTSDWSASSPAQQVYFKEDGFTGITFYLSGIAMLGIATGGQSVSDSYVDVDFSWYRNANNFYVYEKGAYMFGLTGTDISVLTIRIESDDSVTYLMRDDIIYRSNRKVQWPLRVDNSLYAPGSYATVSSINFAAGYPKAATRVPLVIAGANIAVDEGVTVSLNGIQYPVIRKANNYVAIAIDAVLAVAGTSFTVTLSTPTSGSASASLVLSPAVTGVSASKGSTAGNHLITISGSGFTASSAVTIGSVSCVVKSFTFNTIVCLTGASAAVANLTVSVAGAQCVSSVALVSPTSVAFACPTYSYVASTFTVTSATFSNGAVTVSGSGFNIGDTATLIVGSYFCTSAAISDNSVYCSIPSTVAGGTYDVALSFAYSGGAASKSVTIPITASVSTPTIGSLGGARVTVTGAYFGTSATLMDGSTDVCASTDHQTGTSFVCTTAAGTFTKVVVSTGSATSSAISLVAATTYAPTISGVSPTVLYGFAIVTISGSNFVNVTSVTIGGVDSTILSQTSSQIILKAGSIPSGSVSIMVASSARGTSAAFTGGAAARIAVSSASTTAVVGSVVTISGSGFSSSSTYSVSLGSYSCDDATYVSSDSLSCLVSGPADYLDSSLDITVSEFASTSTSYSGSYAHTVVVAPTVSSVSPASGTKAGGVVLTITGTGFDDNPQNNYVLVGGARCMADTSSSTEITCVTSAITSGTSGTYPVSVATNSISSTSNGTFTATLAVSGISPSSAISVEGGLSVTIAGSGFPDNATFSTIAVTVGGISCPFSSVTATQIVCALSASPRPSSKTLSALLQSYPDREDSTALVRVIINGTTADINDSAQRIQFLAASTPTITAVTTSTTTVYSGSVVTITGTGFAASGNSVELRQLGLTGGTSPCTIQTQSATSITCVAALTTFGKHFVKVVVPNVGYAKTQRSCAAGQYLTCNGDCISESDCSYTDYGIFGDCATLLSVVAGDTFCHSNGGSDRVNKAFTLDNGAVLNLNCPMYSCEANDCNSTVTLGGHAEVVSTCGIDPNGFVVTARAHITSITGTKASSLYGGARLTIVGTNLDLSTIFIIGGGAYCAAVSVSGNSVVCETVAVTASASGLSLTATAGGVAVDCDSSVCNGVFSYIDAVPTVTSLSPLRTDGYVELWAGTPITISGTGFSSTIDNNIVTVGGNIVTVTSASESSLVFTAPALYVGDYTIAVRITTVGLTAAITPKARVRPIIAVITPAVSSTLGGNTIAVTGSGLYGSSTASYTLSTCGQPSSVVSANLTTLVFVTPICAAGTRTLSATVDKYGSTCKAASCTIVYTAPKAISVTTIDSSRVSITTAAAQNATLALLTINVGNGICTVYASSAYTYNCSLPAYHAAGTYPIDIILAGTGRLSYATTYPVIYTGSVTSISPSTGSIGGSQTVTITGSGFATSASQLSVRVAGSVCTPTSLSATQIICVTSAVSAATTNVVNITLAAPVGSGSLTGASFSYSADSTPTLTSVSPSRGSTAGGTMLTIIGTRLSTSVVVTINGVVCTQTANQIALTSSASGAAYYCTTGALSTSRDSVLKAVDNAVGAASNTLSYDYIDLWSRWTTWGNTAPPVYGDSVVISEGQTIMLDYNGPQLFLVLVMGHLMFDESMNITLEATYIMINYGRFTIGTPESPYVHNAVIRLFGDRLTPEIPVHGSKVLALRHGALDIHGIPRHPTFTKLAATAEARSNTIQVRGPVDWVAGEEIVVTTTDFMMEHSEKRTILAVANAATATVTITLTEPLYFRHNGQGECFDNNKVCIEEIGDVMLLTRNIKIVGDNRTQNLGFGGTMFLMPMGQNGTLYARVSYTEFTDVGQQYIVGRYPVHFHVTGTNNNSFCIGNSVHRSLNRAFSIHGVNNNTYIDNVVYDTQGHAFFIEDGNERYNNITHNIVALVHVSTSNLNTDLTPAAFWCVSPNNFITNNIAAGSAAYGFWISPFYPYSTGPGYSTSVCPSTHPLTLFENNTAHASKKYGLNIFQYFWPKVKECDTTSADAPGVIKNFFSWKNKIHGVSMAHSEVGEIGAITFENLISANNGEDHEDASAFWVEHINAKNMSFGIRKAYLIAQTSNEPHTSIHTRRGINLPLGDNFFAEDVTFINYQEENYGIEPQRWANRMSFCFPWGWEALFRRTSWVNAPNKMRMRFVHHGIINDEDGTFGSGTPNTQIIPYSTLLDPTYCKSIEGSPVTPAVACTAAHKLRRFGLASVNEVFSDQLFQVDDRSEIVPQITREYSMSVPANKIVTITFQSANNPSTFTWAANDRFRQNNEKNIFQTLYQEVRATANATFDGVLTAMMDRRPTLQDTTSGYYFGDKVATALIVAPVMGVKVAASTCPWSGCPIEPVDPAALGGPCVPWELASSWNSGAVPAEGAAVRINFTESICLSVPNKTYRVYSLYLGGKIEVNSSFCKAGQKITLYVEKYIHVRGGILQAGSPLYPLACEFEIIIGQVDFNDMGASTVVPWAARALVVESGSVQMYGSKKTRIAHLSATSSAGTKTLTLDRDVNWAVGDTIAISQTRREVAYTSSEDRTEESEDVIISAINGRTVTLTAALSYEHFGASVQTLNGVQYNIGAEVVCLTRNVKITGGHKRGETIEYNYGWYFHVGCTSDILAGCGNGDANLIGFPMGPLKTGAIYIDSVQFDDIGQQGSVHAAMVFDGLITTAAELSARTSYVRNSAFNRVRAIGINIHSSTSYFELTNNTLFNVDGDGVRVGGQDNTIDGNIILQNRFVRPLCHKMYDATIKPDCVGAAFRINAGNTVQNNIAASGDGAGFLTIGESCDSATFGWKNNFGLRHRDGLIVSDILAEGGTPDYHWTVPTYSCRVAGGVNVFSNSDQGVAIWYATGDVTARDIVAVDNLFGVTALLFNDRYDRGEVELQYVLEDSTIAGHWTNGQVCDTKIQFRCRMTMVDSENWCKTIYNEQMGKRLKGAGVLEAVFVDSSYMGRNKGESKFMWIEPDSYATVKGRAQIKNVFFDNFDGVNGCDQREIAFFQDFFSNDTFHQHTFEGITWGPGMKTGGEYYAWDAYGDAKGTLTEDAQTVFLNYDDSKKGGFWPDAPYKQWLIDLDGSFSKTPNVLQTIFNSRTIARNATFDKILYDGQAFRNNGAPGAIKDGCAYISDWNAYRCTEKRYVSLTLESYAEDALTRRPGPLVMCKGDGMVGANGNPLCQGGESDFASGPVSKGKVQRATLDRLSRWRFTLEIGFNYTLSFRGAPPVWIRMWLSGHEYTGLDIANVGVVVNMRYFGENARMRSIVYVDGIRKTLNSGYGNPYTLETPTTFPMPFDAVGTHYHNLGYYDTENAVDTKQYNIMSTTLRPNHYVDWKQESIISVTATVSMTEEDFFDNKATFAIALASTLGISSDRLKFATIVAGTYSSRRQLMAASNASTTANFEIGMSDADINKNADLQASAATNDFADVLTKLNAISSDSSIGGVMVSSLSATEVKAEITVPDVSVSFNYDYVLLNVTRDDGVAFNATYFKLAILDYANSVLAPASGVSTTIPAEELAQGSLWTYYSVNITRMALFFSLEDDLATSNTLTKNLYTILSSSSASSALPAHHYIVNIGYVKQTSSSDSNALATGFIVLIAIGCVVIVGLMIGALIYVIHQRRQVSQSAKIIFSYGEGRSKFDMFEMKELADEQRSVLKFPTNEEQA